jgi:hypothetical protein
MFAGAEIFLFDRSCCDYRVAAQGARVRGDATAQTMDLTFFDDFKKYGCRR